MNSLVFANIPHDCREDELQHWLEEKGFTVTTLTVIRDTVSCTSPAFARVQLTSLTEDQSPIDTLNRQDLRGHKILVRADGKSLIAAASWVV